MNKGTKTLLIRSVFFVSFIVFKGSILFSQASDSIAQRIILIGDAGKQVDNKQPELELVRTLFPLTKNTTVLYLGDNIYPQGLPSIYANNYPEKQQVLDSQVNLVRGTPAKAYFIAGNHDWMQGRSGGWEQVVNQYRYVQSLGLENVQFIPADVCPGPEEIQLSDKVTMIAIDSQWWLHRYSKPGVTYGCEVQTEDALLEMLEDIVNRNEDKLLIFAAHHPFVSYGRHGGYYSIKQHVFPLTDINPKLYVPLPVIGSLYPLARGVFGNIQDVRHPIYKNFTRAVDSILNRHPYCIRVAGHEHNLQLIRQVNQFYIVSGAGSKITPVFKGEELLFGTPKTGFSVLDVIKNGNVRVSFYSSMNDTVEKPLFVMDLPGLDTTPVKPKVYEVKTFPDSVTVAANTKYIASNFKRWLLGDNYREEWTTPVRVKVFDIGKEKGGLKPIRRGGGLQTKSLRLQDANGEEYVLRTVEKFPDNTLPEEFRQTFVKDAVVDGISASYPFAALSIPELSAAAGVPHAKPRLVYVPDDPRLGYYREEFKNTLCIFEEREPGGYIKNNSTEKLLEKLQDDHDNRVDQQAVIKARLLDMFIMDFDRHEDQWRWVTNDTGERKMYFPVPRDRDQAFFVNDGFIPRQVRKPYRLPKFQGFRPKAINIKTFNFNARYFDRSFLNELTLADWEKQCDTLLMQMTDQVIAEALAYQPPEIYPFSAKEIIETLKERRKYLKAEAIEYYKFLAREVDITGSNKREFFDVRRFENGDVELKIYKINKEGEVSRELYSRKFLENETKEIRIYGMAESDSFRVTGSNSGEIKLRLIGGRDKDYFINTTSAPKPKTVIYDFLPENNVIESKGRYKSELSNRTTVNRYERRSFQYDLYKPGLAFAYNRDDGLFLGLGIKHTHHGFRKHPFKIRHEASAHVALATRAFMFKYNIEATDAIGRADLLMETNLRLPQNTINYFGLGNETENETDNGKSINFYRTRFDQANASLLLRNNLTPDVTLAYGASFSYYFASGDANRDRIITVDPKGLDTSFLFNPKVYIGPRFQLLVDNRNDSILPSRGVKWQTDLQHFEGVGEYSSDFTQLNTDLQIYISSSAPARWVLALRFGAGFNFGDYEFYNAQFLSGTHNLRGYRKFRFAGDKMFYQNTEIRYKLADLRTYLLPGSIGILAFHDVGRVWLQGEDSNRWHSGYGLGLWLAPANRLVATGSYTRSREGGLVTATLGYQF